MEATRSPLKVDRLVEWCGCVRRASSEIYPKAIPPHRHWEGRGPRPAQRCIPILILILLVLLH